MFKSASSVSSVASQKQSVYGKSPPQKLYFFIHPHLFVEKHSSVVNNRIKAPEQTRVLCLGFFCCVQRISILATLVYCVA